MTAAKLNFAKEIPGHSVNSIELTLVAAEWACVWILLEPVSLAVSTQWLFANNAFDRIFQDIVANSTN